MAEKIYHFVGPDLVEIPSRDPGHRYRYTVVLGENAYVEFTSAEETARTAEEALPPPPFSGFGRCLASRTGQVIANNTATPIDFDTETRDIGGYHNPASNPDRFTIPVLQAGLYSITCYARFNESTAGAGGTANSGDRGLQIRQGASPVVSVRQRASATSNTEVVASAELEFAEGDVIRAGVLQNCGGTMSVDARFTLRRVAALADN
jgi:hypothetical protein